MDEVVQIIELAAGIFGRPQVQLGLHPPYPLLRPVRGGPRLTGIHQRLRPLAVPRVREPAGPLRHVHGLSPARTTTGPPPRPRAIGGQRASPPPPGLDGRAKTGTPGWFPRSP
jgi:hypothetical protein